MVGTSILTLSTFFLLDFGNCYDSVVFFCFLLLRVYHTLQGDNSLKSVERFHHMIFVYRFKHLGDQNQSEKSCYVASEFIALSLLVGIC